MTAESESSPSNPAVPNLNEVLLSITRNPDKFMDFLENNIIPASLIDNRPAQANLAYILGRRYYHGPRKTQNFSMYTGRVGVKDYETVADLVQNPTPEIELQYTNEEGRWCGSTYIHEAFRLKESADDKHYYFFRAGNPIEKVPPYLRPADVVPSGTYTQAFPDEVKEKIKQELKIDEDVLSWLHYNSDPVLDKYRVLIDIPFNKPLERVSTAGGAAERFNYVEGQWEPSGENYNPGLRAKVAHRLRNVVRPMLWNTSNPELGDGK